MACSNVTAILEVKANISAMSARCRAASLPYTPAQVDSTALLVHKLRSVLEATYTAYPLRDGRQPGLPPSPPVHLLLYTTSSRFCADEYARTDLDRLFRNADRMAGSIHVLLLDPACPQQTLGPHMRTLCEQSRASLCAWNRPCFEDATTPTATA